MTTALRKTGIGVVGDMPWGTHFCHFYETKDDLLETVVAYFKAGLEDYEFCMWVVPEPLTEDEAWGALRHVLRDLDRHVSDRSIEMFRAREWYLKGRQVRPRAGDRRLELKARWGARERVRRHESQREQRLARQEGLLQISGDGSAD